ncbi:MAG TPA: hypothetical protein VFH36_00120 [Acidimicrobiales bacterium]|nr:hypothetical protein [Acidimicrobiales bacterium]
MTTRQAEGEADPALPPLVPRSRSPRRQRRPAAPALPDERGAVIVEYIVLLTFVTLAAATAVSAFGISVTGLYDAAVIALPS